MKKRLNITIEENLLDKIKTYADQNDTSISSLVEEHFEALIKPRPKLKNGMSLVEYMKSLPKFDIPDNYDYKEDYYKAKAKKMGYEDLF
ncbi:DUF6364 family protein [Algoriphagus aquimarinus]|uniref:Uncharacterized protein n=1 Tax=Algoriphagus aquimarinus TaxID=237018 RepID=A0A1I0XL49_9BACT|nr:DUF6364 family protein [Algoriphagus aquimarinus]SFB01614.1 hypothetical protein SAMN04489723_103249 [Algoriphagus aquimarinus]|tara:strand:- start:232626 stop:232892 length:267 start_codon:yes stop_codon:yes gene_type:complete